MMNSRRDKYGVTTYLDEIQMAKTIFEEMGGKVNLCRFLVMKLLTYTVILYIIRMYSCTVYWR